MVLESVGRRGIILADGRSLTDTIVARVLAEAGVPHLLEILSERLQPADLHSLLLQLGKLRADKLAPADVFRQYVDDRLLGASDLGQRELAEFDRLAFTVIPAYFEAIELSPICPLGTNSAVACVDQKNVLSTARAAEVVADLGTALALEAARRRRALLQRDPRDTGLVKLCSSHRLLRLQRFKTSGFAPHFRVLALGTAGRGVGGAFEMESMRDHLGVYLRLLERLGESGYCFRDVDVAIADLSIAEALVASLGIHRDEICRNTQSRARGVPYDMFDRYGIDLPRRVVDPEREAAPRASRYPGVGERVERLAAIKRSIVDELARRFPAASFGFDLDRLAGFGHYAGVCFKISATDPEGRRLPLVDGGVVSWTQELLNSRKERFFTSGIGSELVCRQFKAPAVTPDGRT